MRTEPAPGNLEPASKGSFESQKVSQSSSWKTFLYKVEIDDRVHKGLCVRVPEYRAELAGCYTVIATDANLLSSLSTVKSV